MGCVCGGHVKLIHSPVLFSHSTRHLVAQASCLCFYVFYCYGIHTFRSFPLWQISSCTGWKSAWECNYATLRVAFKHSPRGKIVSDTVALTQRVLWWHFHAERVNEIKGVRHMRVLNHFVPWDTLSHGALCLVGHFIETNPRPILHYHVMLQ